MEHISPKFAQQTAQQRELAEISRRYHSITLPGQGYQAGLVPESSLESRIEAFGAKERVKGASVLDVGTASGWNAFWCEANGAAMVTAMDHVRYEDFVTNHRALNSRVQYVLADISRISQRDIGVFDLSLCFGVLYHCRHPLRALEALCGMTREVALIESFVIDPPEGYGLTNKIAPLLEFYERDELGGQIDNWCGPTSECLLALIRSAGFCAVEVVYLENRRMGVKAFRKYPRGKSQKSKALEITGVISNLTGLPRFEEGREEFLEIYFRCSQPAESELIVEVDEFGLPTLASFYAEKGAGQIVARLPDWLLAGTHQVSLRHLTDSVASTYAKIEVGQSRKFEEVWIERESDELKHRDLQFVDRESMMPLELLSIDAVQRRSHVLPPAKILTVNLIDPEGSDINYVAVIDNGIGINGVNGRSGAGGQFQVQFLIPDRLCSQGATILDLKRQQKSAYVVLNSLAGMKSERDPCR